MPRRPVRRSSTTPQATRATLVDVELRRLAGQIELDFFAVCELAREAIDGAYYARFGYEDGARYLEDRLGLSWRSVRRRLAVLEAVHALPARDQDAAKTQLAAVGAHKAAALAPALKSDPAGWRDWVRYATEEPLPALQARVSRTLGHRPRGSAVAVQTQKGERWYAQVLAGLPEDLQELTQRAFTLAEGPLQKSAPTPFECWGAIVEEFLGTYEPQAARG